MKLAELLKMGEPFTSRMTDNTRPYGERMKELAENSDGMVSPIE